MVQGGPDARTTGAKIKDIAMVTGSASGGIVSGTLGAGIRRGAHNTRDGALTDGLVHRTNTCLSLFRECSQDSMLIAVEQRLSHTKPKPDRPLKKNEHKSVKF